HDADKCEKAESGCEMWAQTVRERCHAFNERGRAGLGIPPGSGRKPRLTPVERSRILGLVTRPPWQADRCLTGQLAAPRPAAEPAGPRDTLTAAAHTRGIPVARSPVRRLVRQDGVRW